MNKLDASAYRYAFEAIFHQVKKNHPEFRVSKTLNGIIADWSDTQLQGLQAMHRRIRGKLWKAARFESLDPIDIILLL